MLFNNSQYAVGVLLMKPFSQLKQQWSTKMQTKVWSILKFQIEKFVEQYTQEKKKHTHTSEKNSDKNTFTLNSNC